MHLDSLMLILSVPFWILILQALGVRLHLFLIASPQKAMVPYCLVVALVIPFLILAQEGEHITGNWQLFLLCIVFSAGLAHVYFHIFNMSETARRIKILVRLKQEVPGVSPTGFALSDSPQLMIERRIDRLLKWNQVEKRGEMLCRKLTILTLASVVVRWHERLLFPERWKSQSE